MRVRGHRSNKKAGEPPPAFAAYADAACVGLGRICPLLLLAGWMPLEVQHNLGALFAAL
jgi:hypothetical protein